MKTTVTFLALLAVVSSSLAVDLTPRYIDTFEAGVAGHRLYFSDGEKKIGLSLDREKIGRAHV